MKEACTVRAYHPPPFADYTSFKTTIRLAYDILEVLRRLVAADYT
jgi:hypothetical protein